MSKFVIAYTDGSSMGYKDKSYGSGVVIYNGKNEKFIHELKFSGPGSHVKGEVEASILAIKWAIKNNCDKILIKYDNDSVQGWAIGFPKSFKKDKHKGLRYSKESKGLKLWDRNCNLAKSYHKFIKAAYKNIFITRCAS